jgi:tRNA (uracil-5-)-methyltransferase TRM9
MELTIARQLADLNRRFYADHASAFAYTRSTPQPGIHRILTRIPSGAHVLEIGCGDGKVARALVEQTSVGSYLGLDLDEGMIERARQVAGGRWQVKDNFPPATFHLPPISFALADLTSFDWSHVLSRSFDWILAFSVFHHLPGLETRAQILRDLAGHLAPGGTCVMSNWQFIRSERLKQHIVPWSALNLTTSDVEPNDYLLSWERNNKRGLRYVHVLGESEARSMAEAAGLTVEEVFHSDGVSSDLADYVVMQKRP